MGDVGAELSGKRAKHSGKRTDMGGIRLHICSVNLRAGQVAAGVPPPPPPSLQLTSLPPSLPPHPSEAALHRPGREVGFPFFFFFFLTFCKIQMFPANGEGEGF